MQTMILRVKKCGQMTTVQSEKSENGVLDKRTLVLRSSEASTRTAMW